MKALIDADIIRYRVGFACQHTWYHVYVKGEEADGPIASFGKKRDADAWINGETEIYSLTPIITVEPLEYCLHSVKQTIRSIYESLKTSEYQLFLSGERNFRRRMNPEYKANRDPNYKPKYYNEITEYLIKYWDATVVQNLEADDALAIEQMSDLIQYEYEKQCGDNYTECWANTIICSIDKDLDMIPGWHYNFVKKEKYWIDEWTGIKNFYTQMLVGDRADNVFGIAGIGPKTAAKLFKDCKTEIQLWEITKREYIAAYPECSNEEIMQKLRMTADMLWILRYPNSKWEVPNDFQDKS